LNFSCVWITSPQKGIYADSITDLIGREGISLSSFNFIPKVFLRIGVHDDA